VARGNSRPYCDATDLFNARAPTMQVTDRSGKNEFVNVKWRKPVAMLISGGTRSGKEVLAYGFKKYRLGELIGTWTEGAVLAATAFLIGSGLTQALGERFTAIIARRGLLSIFCDIARHLSSEDLSAFEVHFRNVKRISRR
jgi:hypothetical protein